MENIQFKKEIRREGDRIVLSWGETDKKRVSVHFRRTDYLVLSSLNLGDEYYTKAFEYFDQTNTQWVIFSDDVEYCKNLELFSGRDTIFVEGNSAGIDMYLMTQCDSNIIANSTFSFWGAFLNKHEDKVVVCPHDFIGESSPENLYINGNYYPDSWIAI